MVELLVLVFVPASLLLPWLSGFALGLVNSANGPQGLDVALYIASIPPQAIKGNAGKAMVVVINVATILANSAISETISLALTDFSGSVTFSALTVVEVISSLLNGGA